jgi:hypothetical protein
MMNNMQNENWRRSFINGHKAQLLKRWRDQERKREQKKCVTSLASWSVWAHG